VVVVAAFRLSPVAILERNIMTAFGWVPLDSPAIVMQRLSEIERDLAERQNSYERAAGAWYAAQREIRRVHATALLGSPKTSVTEKKADADIAAAVCDGSEHEAVYESLKAVLRVLETRAMIAMAILKAQGRA
jgi:hypothetical protein